MKKFNSIFITILIMIFIGTLKVNATDVSGNGVAGNYGGSFTSTCRNCKYAALFDSGLRISILDGNGRRLVNPIDVCSPNRYALNDWRYGNGCSKIEYLKGTCTTSNKPIVNVDSGLIRFMDSQRGAYTNTAEALQIVYNYLENSNYYNLKRLVRQSGYNCIDNVGGSGICSISQMNDTYVVVEPMSVLDAGGSRKYYGTAYELARDFTDSGIPFLNPFWGRFASFMTPNGNYFGLNMYNQVSGSNYHAAVNSTSTNGLVVYKLSDIVEIPKNGTLTVNKVNESGSYIWGLTKFNIYSGSNCSGAAQNLDVYGTANLTLTQGTYSIKETSAPSSYVGDNTCRTFVINANQTTTVSVTNTQTCQSEYNALSAADKANPDVRMNLYNKYLEKGQEYRNLLIFYRYDPNFNNACGNPDPSECKANIKVGCLSAKYDATGNRDFYVSNLSCYDEKLTVIDNTGTAETAFCKLTNFNFFSILGPSGSEVYSFGNNFKSGQMIINRRGKVIASDFVKQCFVYDKNKNGNIGDAPTTEKYTDPVKTVSLDNKVLQSMYDYSWYKSGISVYGFINLNKRANTFYSLNPVYSMNGSGKLSSTSCPNCKLLGYGYAAKLNDSDGIHSIPFNIEFDSSALNADVAVTPNACTYGVKKEIIDTPDDPNKNEKVNLEFRIIDTSNPFPGKNGLGRKVGTNWCDSDNCNVIDNNVIKEKITDANNSYDKNKTGSKYTITLTPETIKNIREYNKSHSYDDYTLRCEGADGTNCKSTFLESFNIKKK